MGGTKKQTIGYKYYLGMHMVLCHGPIDRIIEIQVGEKVAWQGVEDGGQISIDKPRLFGGNRKEGGIEGLVDIDMGGPTQVQNTYLLAQLGSLVTAFRGVVSVVLRQVYLGTSAYIKPWKFRAERIHLRQNGIAQWYDEKAEIGSSDPLFTADFSQYANVAAMHVEWIDEDLYSNVTYTLEDLTSRGRPGKIGPKTNVTGGVATSSYLRYTITGLVPGRTYVLHKDIYGEGAGFVPPETLNQWAIDYAPQLIVANASGQVVTDGIGIVGGPNGSFTYDNVYLSEANGSDMNPIHIIREALTDPDWGMGYQETDIDDVSFEAAADTLYDEGFGMSLLWDRQMVIEDFIKEVVRHIDAALYVSRTTGKFVIKLIRDDYDVGTLITLDESNISKIANPAKPTFGELSNSVSVVYWNRNNGKDASVSFTDTAMVQMQGQVIGTSIQYPGFTSQRNASIACRRDLRALSASFLSCTIYTNSVAKGLNIGDTFKLTWPIWQVEELVMRVTGMALGDGKSNQIRITCAQDIFRTPAAIISQNPGTGWVDPSEEPDPPSALAQMAAEAPYYELAQELGQSTIDTTLGTNPEIGYVMAAAAAPDSAILGELWTDVGAGYVEAGELDFCGYATLTGAINQTLTVLPVTGLVDDDLITVGELVQLGTTATGMELCRVDAVDVGGGTVTVGRGCLDTTPKNHIAGTPLFFWDNYNGFDASEYLLGETIGVKVTAVSGAGGSDVVESIAMSVVMDQRAFKPYPPGQFQINGVYYTALTLAGTLTLTWVDRDRLQQTSGTIYDHTAAAIGPEAGTTYRVRVYSDNVLIDTIEPAASGVTVTPSAGGSVRIEVHAKRDGVYSWQPASHTFSYPVSGTRLTEEADTRYTEDGNIRVTEN